MTRRAVWLAAKWNEPRHSRPLAFLAMAAAAGTFAVLCAILRGGIGRALIAVVVVAPVVSVIGALAEL